MLSASSITAGYGDTVVLRDVSLEVPASTVVALLGPNGAGKTTLLKVVSGFIRPTEGRVEFDGRDVTRWSPQARSRAGLCHVPEGRGIFPSLTVRENIVLQAPKGGIDTALDTAREVFPVLGQRINQVAGSMSGGEQQMLALLRAYVANPKLVVVDEASLGLAPLIVDQIFDALRAIVATGASLLIVEQYVHRALGLSDRVYLLNRGSVAFTGASRDIDGEAIFEHYLGVETSAA
jgi:branched-chain amino acid transport system ATP-binding protein